MRDLLSVDRVIKLFNVVSKKVAEAVWESSQQFQPKPEACCAIDINNAPRPREDGSSSQHIKGLITIYGQSVPPRAQTLKGVTRGAQLCINCIHCCIILHYSHPKVSNVNNVGAN